MKIALLSDIHGNRHALEAVIHDIQRECINTLLIAGDFVGYYYEPKEILELIKPFEVIACKGNHEALFEQWLEGTDDIKTKLNDKYGHGFHCAQTTLSESQIDWSKNLQHPEYCQFDSIKCLLSHGSPWDRDLYLYKNTIDRYQDNFSSLADLYDIVILGHAHYQYSTTIGGLLVVNPGSIGQPRSGKLNKDHGTNVRAQWAILDTESRQIDFKTTFYDASPLFEAIDRHDPSHPYLKNVLCREE